MNHPKDFLFLVQWSETLIKNNTAWSITKFSLISLISAAKV